MARKSLVPILLPLDPVQPMEAVTKQYVDAKVSGGTGPAFTFPIGSIIPWSSVGAVPAGWLECDGSTLNQTNQPDLAALLQGTFNRTGETYPAVCRLPDLRRRFPRGNDPTNPGTYVSTGGCDDNLSDTTARAINHSHTLNSHTHGMNAHVHNATNLTTASVNSTQVNNTATTGSASRISNFPGPDTAHLHNVTGNTGGASPGNSEVPNNNSSSTTGAADFPFVTVRYIILGVTLTGTKGDKGDKGDPGTAGTNGTNGSPGAPGAAGLIVLATGAAVPGGTPAGTVVVRT